MSEVDCTLVLFTTWCCVVKVVLTLFVEDFMFFLVMFDDASLVRCLVNLFRCFEGYWLLITVYWWNLSELLFCAALRAKRALINSCQPATSGLHFVNINLPSLITYQYYISIWILQSCEDLTSLEQAMIGQDTIVGSAQ